MGNLPFEPVSYQAPPFLIRTGLGAPPPPPGVAAQSPPNPKARIGCHGLMGNSCEGSKKRLRDPPRHTVLGRAPPPVAEGTQTIADPPSPTAPLSRRAPPQQHTNTAAGKVGHGPVTARSRGCGRSDNPCPCAPGPSPGTHWNGGSPPPPRGPPAYAQRLSP